MSCRWALVLNIIQSLVHHINNTIEANLVKGEGVNVSQKCLCKIIDLKTIFQLHNVFMETYFLIF